MENRGSRERDRPQTLQALRRRLAELEQLEGRRGEIEAALRDSDSRYRFLYEENPSMYFTVETDGTVLSVNPFGASQLGYETAELVGASVLGVFHPDDRAGVQRQLQVCVDNPGKAFSWEMRKIHKNGRPMWVREIARAVRDRDDRLVVLVVCEDITGRKVMEQDLRRARDEMERRVAERTAELERQRRFLRQVIDVDPNFIFAKDRDGRFTLVNQAVADAYGTTVEELTGKTDADFNANVEEVEGFRRMDREVMETLRERFVPEEPITDSGGRTRWLQTVKRPLLDDAGRATQVLGSATDITARRNAEERLRLSEAALRESQRDLRLLAGRLLTAQEDERRRLAREMHDDLTQRLAGLALQAGRLERLIGSSSGDAREMVRGIGSGLAQLSTDVHALSRRLHPSILTDLGLADAIEAECAAFGTAGRAAARFTAVGVPREIDENVALCLYRIAQEALRNVVKHARTDQVRVRLAAEDGCLTLSVEDDGIGFDTSQVRGVGLGLASMGERARLVGADLTVESRPGAGSTVRVSVPLERIRPDRRSGRPAAPGAR